ncbi:hypothetical protein E3O25_15335 [Cryobacterium sp. TMT1-3]|uniref:hypothetical protein n=1 Tax=Cryobacterium TaxID=69578 RepID=UPI00106C18D5|nr:MULTISPECIES: hypothetical protein [Cryobacterium]TFC24541.1 hypothetical protein E3O25_15335 [Cryobacterium sp. TMT1-3]
MGAGGVAVALTMALAALGPTGAYFSDTAQGEITGSLGSIKISGSGGSGSEGLNLKFSNLLPGEALQTQTVGYENTGRSNQDVWVVFNDADALHALNDLGNFGAFNVTANDTTVFNSTNLADGKAPLSKCGTLAAPGVDDGGILCHPLPKMVQVASNVAPNTWSGPDGHISFGFAYPEFERNGVSKSLDNASNVKGGGAWNSYPVAAPTMNGLPYQIVATQVGQKPGL